MSHFYGGTTLGSRGDGPITVELSSLAGQSLVVTSGKSFTAGGIAVLAGSAVRLTYLSTDTYELAISPGCGVARTSTQTVHSGLVRSSVASPGNSLSSMLTICTGTTRRTYRGTLSLVYSSGAHVVNTLTMEQYLRGVVPRESPASWGDASSGKGMAALQAQAVVARSYAWASNRSPYAQTCDTQTCQVYGGAGLDGRPIEDARTDAAVASTAGNLLLRSGTPAATEFSSSTGGWSAGGAFPAVVDLGDVVSPYHNWSASVPASAIGQAFGIGTLTAIDVLSRNGLGADGGRVLSVQVTGSRASVLVTGRQFRSAVGLRSDWFTIQSAPTQPYLYLTNSPTGATVDVAQPFGRVGDRPITCDWNGDGVDTGAVYRAGMFYLRNSLSPGAPLTTLPLGVSGDLPVCGDWNGDGIDTIGVYRPSTATFYLTNSNTPGAARTSLRLGAAGDIPVAGDWNGDGRSTLGVYRPSTATFYLINTNASTAPRSAYRRGLVGDQPLTGDWNGDGTDSIGLFRPSNHTFYLANQPGGPISAHFSYGASGDHPLGGDWNGDGTDTVGVGRHYRVG